VQRGDRIVRALGISSILVSISTGAMVCVVDAQSSERATQQQARALDTLPIDFHAVSSDGSPVLGLKTEDVQLRIDGRVRPVKWLEWIPLAEAPSPDGSASAAALPPPFGSNAPADSGRTFVIVIENDSFRPGRERPLRVAIDRFLAALSPRDRVALVTMPYGGFKLNLTNDFERVRIELAKIGGQGSSTETGSEMACRTRRTLESLVGLVSGFSGLEAPAHVVFVTSGMAGPRRDNLVMLAPGMCELTVDMFAQVGVAAGAGRASFYVVQPEDLMIKPGANQLENIAGVGFRGSDNPLEGIEHLAGVTGAPRLHLSATGDNTLVRVARETSSYYVLGFEPQGAERNGVSRQIDVKVAREGVAVRVRPNVTIPRPSERRAAPKPQTVTPRTMLREARTFRDLPLRGVGYVSHNPEDGRLKVVCVVEPQEQDAQLTAAAAGLYDESGRLIAQWTADQKNLGTTPVMGALVAPRPGAYRLRVAATDALGRSGSADYEVAAALAATGALKVSSLVLGLSRSGGFTPRMLFGAEPVAIGYLDVYGNASGAAVTVSAEIARTVDGPPIGQPIPGALRPVAGEERLIATVAIPIGALPPGDYVIRALVSSAGQPPARVLRTLRKLRS
jgi:VWFA-related protein